MDKKTIKIRRRKRRGSRFPYKMTAVLAAVFLLLLLKVCFSAGEVNFWRFSGLDKNQKYNLIINDEPIGGGISENDDILYIDLDIVRDHLDPNIYYNAEESRVIITTATEVLRYSDGAGDLNFPVFSDSGEVYLPLSLVERVYGAETTVLNDGAILSLDTGADSARLSQKAKLYAKAEKKAYFAEAEEGSSVFVYGEENGFARVKVMTDGKAGGFVGYVRSDLTEGRTPYTPPEEDAPVLWKPDGRICLAFDQISNAAGAAMTMSGGVPEGVNVLCPTWFSFKDTSGEIVNKANMDYVNWAHENGLHVWGLITDNFDAAVSHAVISDDETREYVIGQIAAYAEAYGLDGINVDFEAVPKADGESWIQFLRELVPVCHKSGLTVSADLFVPKAWTLHYDRRAVAETVDHVIVMGYDEHYGGSESAGSVASYDWSVTAVKGTINAGVPAEKLVLGIPFYTRIWTEKTDGTLDSKAYSMDAAGELLETNGAEYSYDKETGQTYAEYTDAEGRHRCWIEDAESVRKRAELVGEYDLAGIAAWKLRMESAGIFHVINEEL